MKNQKKMKFLKIFKILRKNRIFTKKVQTSNFSKRFAFCSMAKPKKVGKDFVMKIAFPKNFDARALPRAARAESHIAVKTQKSCFFLT